MHFFILSSGLGPDSTAGRKVHLDTDPMFGYSMPLNLIFFVKRSTGLIKDPERQSWSSTMPYMHAVHMPNFFFKLLWFTGYLNLNNSKILLQLDLGGLMAIMPARCSQKLLRLAINVTGTVSFPLKLPSNPLEDTPS